MNLSLRQATAPLHGTATVPGDKSLAHRAALFAALAEGDSEIGNFPDSGVTRAMRGALEALGVAEPLEDGVLRVRGNGFRPFRNGGVKVFCGNSGTTMRLLAGALAGTGTAAILDGTPGLRKRPMDRIVEPLRAMGTMVTACDGKAPLAFGEPGREAPLPVGNEARSTAKLHAFDGTIPVASAQTKSCLILAALGADGPSTIREPGPSRDHTERMLAAMGATAAYDAATHVAHVAPLSRPLAPLHGDLAGDISSAAFLFVAAAIIPGSRIIVRNVGLNPTRTGILDVLRAMGAGIRTAHEGTTLGEPVGDIELSAAPLHGVEIGGDLVVRTIDEFPAVAVAAAFADGVTTVRDAKELRFKETDRIVSLVTELAALGVDIQERPDGFVIHGGTLKGGTADALGDHRLAMSLALCGLRAPVTVTGAEILNESFPCFTGTLAVLGAR